MNKVGILALIWHVEIRIIATFEKAAFKLAKGSFLFPNGEILVRTATRFWGRFWRRFWGFFFFFLEQLLEVLFVHVLEQFFQFFLGYIVKRFGFLVQRYFGPQEKYGEDDNSDHGEREFDFHGFVCVVCTLT